MTIFQKHNFALLMENIKISIEETGEVCQVDRTLRFRNNYWKYYLIKDLQYQYAVL